MKLGLNRKYIALLMVMVILAGSMTGFCRSACAIELPRDAKYEQGTGYLSTMENPVCPVDEHSVPHHCDSFCHCSCHALLMEQPVQVVRLLEISSLLFSEPFKALAEVFLSKFIPPHIQA